MVMHVHLLFKLLVYIHLAELKWLFEVKALFSRMENFWPSLQKSTINFTIGFDSFCLCFAAGI